MSKIEVKVPDIGDFQTCRSSRLLVKPGDVVKAEQSLMTLESDKASMDVPSPAAGTVKEIVVKVGDKVSMGSTILTLEDEAGAKTSHVAEMEGAEPRIEQKAEEKPAGGASTEVKVPDIGDFKDVPVIEVLVKPGDAIKAEQSLLTLESDKASMDVPSPTDGVVGRNQGQGRRQGFDGLGDPDA